VGKFEGDPFERLYCRLDDDREHLCIRIESGEEIKFDLMSGTFACVDPKDPCMLVMDIQGNIVVLKVRYANLFSVLNVHI
jgi:hypothetical protein